MTRFSTVFVLLLQGTEGALPQDVSSFLAEVPASAEGLDAPLVSALQEFIDFRHTRFSEATVSRFFRTGTANGRQRGKSRMGILVPFVQDKSWGDVLLWCLIERAWVAAHRRRSRPLRGLCEPPVSLAT